VVPVYAVTGGRTRSASAELPMESLVSATQWTPWPGMQAEYRSILEMAGRPVSLVEIGAGIINVSLFAGEMLVGLKSIPFGAADITDDIASAFGTTRGQAERMKCFHGSANATPRDNHEMIAIRPKNWKKSLNLYAIQ
jgi:cell division protein FtsA